MGRIPVLSAVSLLLTLLFSPAQGSWPSDGLAVCTVTPSQQTGPKIVDDGDGGAIIAWSDGRGCVYAQRVDAAGNTLWTPNGVPVCASAGTVPVELASDGEGGAFVVWYSGGAHAQRIDAEGNLLWPVQYDYFGSGLLHDAISDGAGRVLFATFSPTGSPSFVRVQCLDGSGSPQWTPTGVVVESGSGTLNWRFNPKLTVDGLGGALVTWYTNGDLSGYDVKVQRVDAAGTASWTAPITTTDAVGDYDPQIVSDEAGGAIIAWWAISTNADVYAQRVDASGTRLWTSNGVPVCVQPDTQDGVVLASDGAAGAIVAWVDKRGGVDTDVYAQRVDATGAAQWTPNGVVICDLPASQNACRILADGTGGAFVVWSDARSGGYDVYAQRVDALGVTQWTEDGLLLCGAEGNQTTPRITLVDSGDAIVAWQDTRSSDADIYARRVTVNGPTSIGVTPKFAHLELDGNAPNPFSGSTDLHIRLALESDVRVDLYNVAGRRVATRTLGRLAAGAHTIAIGDRGIDGRMLPSGVYFCRVTAAGEVATRKITITH